MIPLKCKKLMAIRISAKQYREAPHLSQAKIFQIQNPNVTRPSFDRLRPRAIRRELLAGCNPEQKKRVWTTFS
jgi:hypothetical protein